MPRPKLQAGCKAYYDAYMFGLIPCKVLSVESTSKVRIELTASRGQYDTYKRGEIIETNNLSVIPRECVRVRSYTKRIRPYDTILDSEESRQ